MNPLGWRTAVREISWKVYSQVLEAAGLTTDAVPESVAPQKGELKEVTVEDLLVARPKGLSGGGGGREGTRRSTQSKWIGDRAEEAVYHWLKEKLPADQAATLDWHAQRGHTPGYDLSYRDETDQLIGVEVKGTTLARFPSIELTGNEWRAAGDMGSRFRMALVSGVGKADSQIAFLDDPSGACGARPTHCVAQFMADLWRHGSPGGHGLARALRLRSPSWPRSRSAETFYERECQDRAPPRLDAKRWSAWHSAPWLE